MNYRETRLFKALKRQITEGSKRVVSWGDVFNHESAMRFQALLEGAQYADQHMTGAFASPSSYAVLVHSLEHGFKQGLILELGDWRSQTLKTISDKLEPSRTVHSFNSSESWPDDEGGPHGTRPFRSRQELTKAPANVRLHRGPFDKTLHELVQQEGDKVAFVHIDCDSYS